MFWQRAQEEVGQIKSEMKEFLTNLISCRNALISTGRSLLEEVTHQEPCLETNFKRAAACLQLEESKRLDEKIEESKMEFRHDDRSEDDSEEEISLLEDDFGSENDSAVDSANDS